MKKPTFTMASELIKQLQEIVDLHGDLPVATWSSDFGYISSSHAFAEQYYWDGGYCAPVIEDECLNWMPSRSNNGLTEGFPQYYIKLQTNEVLTKGTNKLNGRPLGEIHPEDWRWYEEMGIEERNIFDGEFVKYKVSAERDARTSSYPSIAFLESTGLSAVGEESGCSADAREALEKKYIALKKLKAGELDPAELLTSNLRSEREIAKDFLEGKY